MTTNLTQQKRERMLGFLQSLADSYEYDKDKLRAIKEIEVSLTEKKYGLLWEDHEEDNDIKLVTHIPVFSENKSRKINKIARGGGSFNFILEGDNLHSLALLQKTHKNSIEVIYIDPPYNTKNKDFVYDDSIVDLNDGYRHSKWLSFMARRLTLAKDLLTEDGVIFISIDENEFAQLKLLCDEVFGEQNFVENFIWVKSSIKNLSNTTSTNHEYILCYAKNINVLSKLGKFRVNKSGYNEVLELVEGSKNRGLSPEETEKKLQDFYKNNKHLKGISGYKFIDKQYRVYGSHDLSAPKATGVANTYNILHPDTGEVCKRPQRGWIYNEEKLNQLIQEGAVIFGKDHTTVPRFKRLLTSVKTEVQKSIISNFKDGKKDLQKVFGMAPFNNAKPISLIMELIQSFGKDITVLDFFAGSGTTGHAVQALNQMDNGSRRYILCTNNENKICEQITYPRLSKIQEELPHNLKYYKVKFIPREFTEKDYEFDEEGYQEALAHQEDGSIVNKEDFMYPPLATNLLLNHIKELIELENHQDLNKDSSIIVHHQKDLDRAIKKISPNGQLYLRSSIIRSASQQKEIQDKNISVIEIPEYYYKEELVQLGEI